MSRFHADYIWNQSLSLSVCFLSVCCFPAVLPGCPSSWFFYMAAGSYFSSKLQLSCALPSPSLLLAVFGWPVNKPTTDHVSKPPWVLKRQAHKDRQFIGVCQYEGCKFTRWHDMVRNLQFLMIREPYLVDVVGAGKDEMQLGSGQAAVCQSLHQSGHAQALLLEPISCTF